MGTKRPLSLVAAVAAVAAATLAAGLVPAPAGAASYDAKPVSSGATWLGDQVTQGLVHNEQYDFDDVGLSIDVALGLDAAGKKPDVVKKITKAVAKNVGSYTAFPPSVYAGATAKAAVLALTQGKNPRAFGGVDLITQLEGLVATTAPITGRIEDAYDPSDPYGGDFANVIGQAYAAQALSQVDSGKAKSVTRFLLRQQCKAGYFRLSFTADKSAADQSCNAAPKAERAPDTDATAIVALALLDIKETQKTKTALVKARDWLVAQQAGNGSFGGGTATETANTNSTGLAGTVLGLTGRTKQAQRAATYVRSLQVDVTSPCLGALKGQTGAIAYDVTAYEAGYSKGIKPKTSDQWRRASAQALPVLRYAPAADGELVATGPAGTVAGGSTFKIALQGVAPGQRVCVTRGGSTFEYVPGRNPITQVTVGAPHGTATRHYTVYVGGERRDVAVRVRG